MNGFVAIRMAGRERDRHDEECLYRQRIELLGASLAATAVFHLPFHNHVHVYERLPFAKQFFVL